MELEIKKAKTNGIGSKVAAYQKPCQKMTEGVVMDGGRRGELVKVCADPCRVHHPDTPSPEQVAKEWAEERKRIEKSFTSQFYGSDSAPTPVFATANKAAIPRQLQFSVDFEF